MNKVQIKARYDRKATSYDKAMSFLGIAGLDKLRKELLQQANGKVLEIAAGTGKNLDYYPREVIITITDLSPAMLEVAKERADRLGIDLQCQAMDAEKLQFPNDTFDTVVSTLSLCTIPNPVAALKEIKRVCKPNGQLLLLERGKSDVGFIRLFQDAFAETYAKATSCHWDRKPDDLVKQAGLTTKTSKQVFFGIFYLMVARP
jgi:ubiquinone/menaquinone biosynthesis C-methylase UbiE